MSPPSFGPPKSTANPIEQLAILRNAIAGGKLKTFEPLLPMTLSMDGKPYTLKNHCQFEPMFKLEVPNFALWKCARQTGKTRNSAARDCVMAACVPRFRRLVVAPLFDQTRRYSSDHVRPLIDESPIRRLLVNVQTEKSVLRRTFANGSMIAFTFAGLSVDRARGFTGIQAITYDEIQDLDPRHLSVLAECMSATKAYGWGFTTANGTPKTPDNLVEMLWLSSSQAEWFIPCKACGKQNIPSLEFDLDKMIGPYREDISPENPALVCAKCSRAIHPPNGRWVHRRQELAASRPGYHVSQPIMWMHYGFKRAWGELLGKREGKQNYTPDRFQNEVLAESCGTGVQLVSVGDLQRAAAIPIANTPDDLTAVKKILRNYRKRVLAVDWGGGGEEMVSLTSMALCGLTTANKVQVPWGRRLFTPHAHLTEAERVRYYFNELKCDAVVHDFSGAGELRETFLRQSGIPLSKIIPVKLLRATAANIMTWKKPSLARPRGFFNLDKTRSLLTTCGAIQLGQLEFFQYDFKSDDDRGLLHDFMALVENKIETRLGSDIYTIVRSAALMDDFAQAVNIGACALWYLSGKWPAVTVPDKYVNQRAKDLMEGEWADDDADDDKK